MRKHRETKICDGEKSVLNRGIRNKVRQKAERKHSQKVNNQTGEVAATTSKQEFGTRWSGPAGLHQGYRFSPKWDKSGTFKDQFRQICLVRDLRKSNIRPIWGQSDPAKRQL